jgi:hypothetical protein
MKSLAEWLEEHPGRYVVIRRAEPFDENDEPVVRPGYVRFDLCSRLPDGRKVAASVEMHCDLLSSPEIDSGSRLVEEAELAIGNLLSRTDVR